MTRKKWAEKAPLEGIMNQTESLVTEIQKVIVGKEEVIQNVLMAILARGHILLEDIPGVGKTTLALAFSRVLGMDYKRIQFTPDVIPSDVVGFTVYDKKADSFIYKPGAVMCNLLLADEINRTSSKTQAALLEVMEEGSVTVDGKTYPVPQPFAVLSTQNPFGSAGTQMLPQSQLDRFMVKLSMGYPDFDSQVNILRDRQNEQPLDSLRQVASKEDIMNMQQEVAQVTVKDNILRYITTLVENTRKHELIQLGVSPRGALAVNNMAKAAAYVSGREYVIPEDIVRIFTDVCAHRVILHPRAKVANTTAEEIMEEIVKETKAAEVA
jgi:MoxR-like ATPase